MVWSSNKTQKKIKKSPTVIQVKRANGIQEGKKSDWPQSLEILEQYLQWSEKRE